MFKHTQFYFTVACIATFLTGHPAVGRSNELQSPAQQYLGPLVLNNAERTIDISANRAMVTLDLSVYNPTDKPVSARIALRDNPNLSHTILLAAGAGTDIGFTREQPIDGDESGQGVRVDSAVTVDGRLGLLRVVSLHTTIILPSGIETVIDAPITSGLFINNRLVLEQTEKLRYMTPFMVKWHPTFQIEVNKKTAMRNGRLDVAVQVTNRGKSESGPLSLRDDFHPALFENGIPDDQFTLLKGKENDVRLVWQTIVDNLRPDESASFNYQLILRSKLEPTAIVLSKTTVWKQNRLVGASETPVRAK